MLMTLIRSNEIADAFFLLNDHWLSLRFHDDSHGLVENVLESLLSQCTALHVLALEFFLDYFLRCFFHDGCLFGVFLQNSILISQIDFVAHKNFGNIANILLKLRVPLS